MNNLQKLFFRIIIFISYFTIAMFLFFKIKNKYENFISFIFWFLLVVIFSYSYNLRNRYRIISYIGMSLFLVVLIIVFLFPTIHDIIYHLFEWSKF